MTELSFEQVMQRARDGEREAFNDLYRTYAARLRGFAQARGNDDAEAIANDVMFRVFQNLASFEGDQKAFVRWIFTIARNRLIDAHRSAQRRPVIAEQEVPEAIHPSAETLALDQLSIEDVQRMLGMLTLEQREVIALRLVEDLSLADVASIVGRPVTAVKALQRRGLKRLQKTILEGGVS